MNLSPFKTAPARRTLVTAGIALLSLSAGATSASAASWDVTFGNGIVKAGDAAPDFVSFHRGVSEDEEFIGNPVVSIVRGGTVLATSTPREEQFGDNRDGYVSIADLQAGDVAVIKELGADGEHLRVTYDGQPTLSAASTCTGATTFTAMRSAGQTLQELTSYAFVPGAQSGGPDDTDSVGSATSETATTISGTYNRPLIAGRYLHLAVRGATTPVADLSDTLTVTSTFGAIIADCLAPAAITPPAATAPATPAPVTPAVPVAPQGTVDAPKAAVLKKLTLAKLQSKGITFSIVSQSPATLKATLVIQTTSGKGKKRKVKTSPISSSSVLAAAGQPASVTVKSTKKTRAKIAKAAKAKGTKLVVQLTLTDASGQVTTLAPTTLSVPKK